MTFDPTRVRAILFDVDGTLADTDDDYIRRAGVYFRRLEHFFPQADPTAFLRWGLMVSETPLNMLMGLPDRLGLDDELTRFFDWLEHLRRPRGSAAERAKVEAETPGASPETPAGVPAEITGHVPDTSGHFVLMAGVRELLEALQPRYPLAVVTARGARATESVLNQFGLARLFGAVAHAQTAPHTKPYADPVLWAAGALGVPVENCVMVGDTTVDILAGKRAGAQTVGVLCGFGERAELERAGATLILEDTADLASVLVPASATRP